ELGDDPIGTYGLGTQPLEFLHFTVQMLRVHRSEVSDGEIDELVDHLTKQVRKVAPFSLRVGPPQAGVHAVEMWVEPDANGLNPQWTNLVEHTRTAASSVFGPDALPPLGPNATPHTSLGYGVTNGDSGVLTSALKRTRQPLVEVPVEQVHLLAVTQRPEQGQFVWDSLATIELGQ
ncbi:2'-5' RNA ligase family protein, partial [Saccharopolyspora taberi]|uniref:2'-5' RNA ligase family protein n=1 Tax=Saccharopolyspora taberi TaxID=60895 RepID=UPI0031DD7E7A